MSFLLSVARFYFICEILPSPKFCPITGLEALDYGYVFSQGDVLGDKVII